MTGANFPEAEMPAEKVQIRKAQPADAEAVAATLHQAFLEFKALYTDAGFAATTLTPEQVVTRMKEGPVWIAQREDAVWGTVAAVLKGDSLYMRGMAVVPAARGSGVGRRLIEEVEHFAAAQSCRRVFLSTTPFLHSAISLYERFGYRRTDEGPAHLFGTPLFTMEKVLSQQ
jgi:ribosomal protein S18 acetylase RimI-like enzyme